MLRPRGNPQNWWFWWRILHGNTSTFFPYFCVQFLGWPYTSGDLLPPALAPGCLSCPAQGPGFVVYWSFSSAAAPGHGAGILQPMARWGQKEEFQDLWLQWCRGWSSVPEQTHGASISCCSCQIIVQTCPVLRLLKAFAAQEGNFVGKSPSLVTTWSWRISSNGVIGLECGFLAFLLKNPLLS